MNTLSKIAFFGVLFVVSFCATAKPSIQDYGNLPGIQQMALSPKAERIAIAKEVNGETYLDVLDLNAGKLIAGTKLGNLKFRGMSFINENLLYFNGTETRRLSARLNKVEVGATMVFDLKRNKTVVMLGKEEGIQPFSSAGGIEKIDRKKAIIYMAVREGFLGGLDNPVNLYRVDAKTGKGKRARMGRGTPHTTGFFINEDNKVIGRTDYHGPKQEFRIYSYLSGKEKLVFTQERLRSIDIGAYLMSKDETVVYVEDLDGMYGVSLIDGSKSEVPGLDTSYPSASLISDGKGHLDGFYYDGTRPYVQFKSSNYDQAYRSLVQTFPGSSVSFIRSRGDTNKVLVHVNGSEAAGDYFLYDMNTRSLAKIGSRYTNISKEFIGQVQSIEYEARDGLTIPAVLTWPVGAKTPEQRKNLPLIVLPHGGPEAHDTVSFDWWSQFLASKGYLVLQPNFRGSTGYGYDFVEKGHGRWGKEMQDDVSDGVLKMIAAGYADKDRVCIMGASYGGYAAMAGGAFTPELYKCVVAVAGVSDLERMLLNSKLNAGSDHWVVRHWKKLMGKSETEKDALKKISPANFAGEYLAPTLLIHGVDDTVVPIVQSKIMHNALEKAGKQSTLVSLKGEDHNLSRSSTRLEMLQVISEFLDKHNPA